MIPKNKKGGGLIVFLKPGTWLVHMAINICHQLGTLLHWLHFTSSHKTYKENFYRQFARRKNLSVSLPSYINYTELIFLYFQVTLSRPSGPLKKWDLNSHYGISFMSENIRKPDKISLEENKEDFLKTKKTEKWKKVCKVYIST